MGKKKKHLKRGERDSHFRSEKSARTKQIGEQSRADHETETRGREVEKRENVTDRRKNRRPITRQKREDAS